MARNLVSGVRMSLGAKRPYAAEALDGAEPLSPGPIGGRAMPRFAAIDGLRAWLSWVVVASHIFQQAFPANELFVRYDVGGHAVDVFIIVSGFVITHQLIERPSPYAAYLIQRFMRLFPAFAVCCAIGAASYVAAQAWAEPEWFESVHGDAWRLTVRLWPQHTAAHLLMLHGAIPNTILPYSQYAFDAPGWSVSLEWQFYLLAPSAIWLCRTPSRSWLLVAIVIIASLSYHFLFHSFWERPSILIGTAKFFLIGIACRFATPHLAGLVAHRMAIGLGLLFTLFWIGSPSIAIWLVVFSFVLQADRVPNGLDPVYVAIMRAALESRPAQYLADRSYSTYLLHSPLIMLIGAVATRSGVPVGVELALWMLLAIPLTALLQEPLYRMVEVPARSQGKRWATRLGATRAVEVRMTPARPLIGHKV